jgi:hypothetical protein
LLRREKKAFSRPMVPLGANKNGRQALMAKDALTSAMAAF